MSSLDPARAFETLGIARSQRSIERYCKSGDLDAFFDPDVRQWYITPQSVERLASYLHEVAQKKGVAQPTAGPTGSDNEDARRATSPDAPESANGAERVRDLEAANRDLEIASRVKDEFIKRLEQDREAFVRERGDLIERLEQRAHQVGLLEAKLQLLEAPRGEQTNRQAPTTDDNEGS